MTWTFPTFLEIGGLGDLLDEESCGDQGLVDDRVALCEHDRNRDP